MCVLELAWKWNPVAQTRSKLLDFLHIDRQMQFFSSSGEIRRSAAQA
jgi:hypothetical protein